MILRKIRENGKRRVYLAILFFALLFIWKHCSQLVHADSSSCEVWIPVSVAAETEKQIPENSFEIVLEAADLNTQNTSAAESKDSNILVLGAGEEGHFGPLVYTVPGDYHYKVYQNAGNEPHMIYDDSVYVVTVRVISTDAGKMEADIWAIKDGETYKTDSIHFINQYEETPQPAIIEEGVDTGDLKSIIYWRGILVISAVGVLILTGRNSKKR